MGISEGEPNVNQGARTRTSGDEVPFTGQEVAGKVLYSSFGCSDHDLV